MGVHDTVEVQGPPPAAASTSKIGAPAVPPPLLEPPVELAPPVPWVSGRPGRWSPLQLMATNVSVVSIAVIAHLNDDLGSRMAGLLLLRTLENWASAAL